LSGLWSLCTCQQGTHLATGSNLGKGSVRTVRASIVNAKCALATATKASTRQPLPFLVAPPSRFGTALVAFTLCVDRKHFCWHNLLFIPSTHPVRACGESPTHDGRTAQRTRQRYHGQGRRADPTHIALRVLVVVRYRWVHVYTLQFVTAQADEPTQGREKEAQNHAPTTGACLRT